TPRDHGPQLESGGADRISAHVIEGAGRLGNMLARGDQGGDVELGVRRHPHATTSTGTASLKLDSDPLGSRESSMILTTRSIARPQSTRSNASDSESSR